MSGRSPFLGHSSKPDNPKNPDNDSVASIIRRIKHGDFRMDSDAFKYVSPAAKSIIKGLLTVDVKKRLNLDSLSTANWINNGYQNNNNNPPSLLMTPHVLNESGGLDRNLKQTFNAYHTVARETSSNHNCLLGGTNRSSSISSSSSSLSSGGASSISSSGAIRATSNNSKTVQEYLQQQQQQQQFLAGVTQPSHYNHSQPPVSIAPLMAEAAAAAAFSGVSYQLMPTSFFNPSGTGTGGGVSITKMGPMTRSRKRKMQDTSISSVSITPAYPGAASSGSNPLEIVTVTKRDRTTAANDIVFPASSACSASAMQYCATARAVVVKASEVTGGHGGCVTSVAASATWTPTANNSSNSSRSVTITID